MPTLNSFLKTYVKNVRQNSAFPRERCLPPLVQLWPTLALFFLPVFCTVSLKAEAPANSQSAFEVSRTVRPWESLDVTGPRAALLGNESGRLDAWVYPLKILRNF